MALMGPRGTTGCHGMSFSAQFRRVASEWIPPIGGLCLNVDGASKGNWVFVEEAVVRALSDGLQLVDESGITISHIYLDNAILVSSINTNLNNYGLPPPPPVDYGVFMQGLAQAPSLVPQEHGHGGPSIMERFKRMAPPSFKGESQPLLVESWMREVEKIFRAIRCAEEDKVSVATYML
ncbi:hypothetical protein Taro_016133 [Colocasia esculenta]|uniref:Uncharacterized protein n=1 Tax=Colocasia esculenta TaxID=4460 RepID=A0A843UJF2_COLES|nr:hypothetical protein [Colocasia esculenta]